MYFGTCVKMKDYEDAKKKEAGLWAMIQNFNTISLNAVKNKLQKCVHFYPILEKTKKHIDTPFHRPNKMARKVYVPNSECDYL